MTRKKSKPKSKLASASEARSSESLQNLHGHPDKTPTYCCLVLPLQFLSVMNPSVTISHPLLEVPLEVWEQVAALSGLQAIARLLAKTSPRIAPLVWLIKSLSFAWAWPGDLKVGECQDALYSLFEVSASGWSIRGATLRCLQWNLPNSYDEALSILVRPGCFPNLREISVRTNGGDNARFGYLLIPGLEKLDCSWSFHDRGHPTFNAFREALQLLPSLSPLLQSLKLRLSIGHSYYNWTSDPRLTAYYERGRPTYDGLIRTINQLHFPALISLEISVRCSGLNNSLPPTEFGPLLLSNPSTREVVLDLRLGGKPGTPARRCPPISAFAYTHLRAFTGSPEYCAGVSAHAPALERLSILTGVAFPHEEFAAGLFQPNVGPRVRHLTVRGVEKYMEMDLQGCLPPQSIGFLVHAFPNTTHLDIHLDGECKISDYRDALVALHDLEYLRMHRVISIRAPYQSAPATVIFPAEQYAVKINETLRPFLPRLREVRMSLFGTDYDWEYCLRQAEYRFCRERGGTKLVLVVK
ncbi:hypothetical protein DFH06DRAFT_1182465 [Mycena polygramma]|nr:hypothetical protein DFH06DRAFT_1182465 [Mycena polygramma]